MIVYLFSDGTVDLTFLAEDTFNPQVEVDKKLLDDLLKDEHLLEIMRKKIEEEKAFDIALSEIAAKALEDLEAIKKESSFFGDDADEAFEESEKTAEPKQHVVWYMRPIHFFFGSLPFNVGVFAALKGYAVTMVICWTLIYVMSPTPRNRRRKK